MTHRLTARNRNEIVVVCDNPPLQFRYKARKPVSTFQREVPGLIRVVIDGSTLHLAVVNSDFSGEGRWIYRAVDVTEVATPPRCEIEGRPPSPEELETMDPAERAEWERRPALVQSVPVQSTARPA